ncbi:MAG: ABC transporter substrate-binding protein [Sarcina sp.]
MKKKTIITTILIVAVIAGLGGARYYKEVQNKKGESKIEENTYKEVEYTYNDGINKPVNVVIKEAPKRAVTLSQFMTEMLLSLDLGNSMVGTALLDNPILPEFKEAYDKIPQIKITEGHDISKEGFLALKPDFVSGWLQSLEAKGTGTPAELEKEGIAPYVASALDGNATINNVYDDYMQLGRIFGVEDKATQVVNKMKADIKAVEDSVAKTSEANRPKVLIYDSGEKDAYVAGGGLANNLITLAGGRNIFGDLNNQWNTVSFESIASKNPDIILVTNYLAQPESVEQKINTLKTNPAFKEVNAVKNNKIYTIDLANLSPGIRNPIAIKQMNEVFYGVKG